MELPLGSPQTSTSSSSPWRAAHVPDSQARLCTLGAFAWSSLMAAELLSSARAQRIKSTYSDRKLAVEVKACITEFLISSTDLDRTSVRCRWDRRRSRA